MATDIFENAEQKEVFFYKGFFTDKPAQRRLVQAPFRLLKIQANTSVGPELFIEPRGFGETHNALLNKDIGTDGQEFELARQGLAYMSGDPIIMEEHELGDWQTNPDDWRGVFEIHFI